MSIGQFEYDLVVKFYIIIDNFISGRWSAAVHTSGTWKIYDVKLSRIIAASESTRLRKSKEREKEKKWKENSWPVRCCRNQLTA